jgi:hypothetical protein
MPATPALETNPRYAICWVAGDLHGGSEPMTYLTSIIDQFLAAGYKLRGNLKTLGMPDHWMLLQAMILPVPTLGPVRPY